MRKTQILFCVSTLAACYAPPAPEERFEESIIVTSHDADADFGEYRTFFIRPDIRILDEDLENLPAADDMEVFPPEEAAPILEATEQNLLDRGYTAAASREEADLAVELVYARNIYTTYYCYYWYDWGYWGYPYYYYYYPYSCDGAAWRSGMMVTQVVDLMNAEPAPEQPIEGEAPNFLRGVWFSGVYGVETGTSAFLMDRALDGIDQAFVQSPYFTAAP